MTTQAAAKQALLFRSKLAGRGLRQIESLGFTFAFCQGNTTVSACTLINGVCHEFVLCGSRLECYSYSNAGLPKFIGYANAAVGMHRAIEAGRAAGLGMFQPYFCKAPAV